MQLVPIYQSRLDGMTQNLNMFQHSSYASIVKIMLMQMVFLLRVHYIEVDVIMCSLTKQRLNAPESFLI